MKDEYRDILVKRFGTARIDIKNKGLPSNNIKILNENLNAEISNPSWFINSEGIGVVIESFAGTLTFEVLCEGEGTFTLWLRGPDVRDKHNVKFPVFIDYINLEINNEKILENKLIWHDIAYIYEKDVINQETIKIHVEWLPFNKNSEYDQNTFQNQEINSLKNRLKEIEKFMENVPHLACTSLGEKALNGKLIYRNWKGLFPRSNKPYNLLDEFEHPSQFWFSHFIEHRFPKEDFKLNFFGPFQEHDNITYDMSGKKIFYSQECLRYRFLEMKHDFDKYALDYVDLAMGYDLIDNSKYLRFPYWFISHIPPTADDEQIEKIVEKWNSSTFEKKYDVSSVSSHDNWGLRTVVANIIEPLINIDYGGFWRNNTDRLYVDFRNNKNEFLKKYKFNLCCENLIDDGYVTEKIFDSFENDCIALYAGGGSYFEPKVINKNAVLKWDLNGFIDDELLSCSLNNKHQYLFSYVMLDDYINQDTLELFKNILTDEKTYLEFKDQDRILKSGSKFIINKLEKLEKHLEKLIYD